MESSEVMIKGKAKSDADAGGPEAPSDVFVSARGIAYGVLGGAVVWVVLLISL